MTYATEQDMIHLFGEKEIVELTNLHDPAAIAIDSVRLVAALEYATGEVDSYLVNHYPLPFLNPPQVLINKVADIARYHLDSIRSREDVRQRYEDALKWLQLVLDGKIKLVSDIVNTGIGFFSEARIFTRLSLNDYIFSNLPSSELLISLDSTSGCNCPDPPVTPVAPVAPQASLTISNNIREFGGDTNVVLEWAVLKQTNPILNIVVEGEIINPSGESQFGSISLVTEINVDRTFSMSVGDSSLTDNKTTSLLWRNKRYWGKINKDGISEPIADNDILSLDGAGVGSGNELAETRQKDYSGINGNGDRLIFAFPSSWGVPSFKVNGFPFTAMTKVRDDPFSNSYGYSTEYQVWISNTPQYVPLDQVLIL
jgi:phage gp36-like protein